MKGNTLYMPTTFPKCNAQFFAATSARRVACVTRESGWLTEDEAEKQHARAPSWTHREVLSICKGTCAYVYTRLQLDRAIGSPRENNQGGEKGVKGGREIYLPEFRRPPPMSPPTNAFRIQNPPRNMFLPRRIRDSSPLMCVRSLLFHRITLRVKHPKNIRDLYWRTLREITCSKFNNHKLHHSS